MPWWRRGGLVVLVMVSVFAGVAHGVPSAVRDGDPASDTLYAASVFYPLGSQPRPSLANQLTSALLKEFHRGDWVKVAILQQVADLGAIPSLWLKPRTYAHFLGVELACRFRGRLVVLMPNGIGVWHGGLPITRETALLKSVRVRPGLDGAIRTAIAAVNAFAKAPAPRPLPPLGPTPPPGAPCF